MKKSLVIFFLMLSVRTFAFHIIGGELFYDFLGKTPANKDIYRITLKIYRDCDATNGSPFDGTTVPNIRAWLTIRGNGEEGVYDIGSPVITKVPSSINSKCIEAPERCVEEGVYTYTIELEPATGGYDLIYQRCCRNTSIDNLLLPDNQGSTYYAHIPGPEDVTGNSSPRFNKFPPLFLCVDIPFSFDHSATDADGDLLVYSFTKAFAGLDNCCPTLFVNGTGTCPNPPLSCPQIAPPPPFSSVNYQSPYDANYPVASNPSLTINPNTGVLSGKPDLLGVYVVCIEVREYRAGKLIGIQYRDFQFNVVSCKVSVVSVVADQVNKCAGNVLTFTNQSVSSIGGLTYKWDFGVQNMLSDTSNVANPTYTYQDTGQYVITLIGNPGKPCTDTVRKTFYVYPLLDVNFPKQKRQCLNSNSFDFSASGSFMPNAKFDWEFGEAATFSVSNVKDPQNVHYDTTGLFHVKLIARHLTCVDSFIDTVRVIPGPIARIATPPFSACVPATLTFSNNSESEEPMRYKWTVNNGATSELKDPTISFMRAGVYTMSLAVITDEICKDTSVASISHLTVHPLPTAGFTFFPRVTTMLDPFITINTTAAPGLTYHYKFGDGASAFYHNVEHVYEDHGTYTITQYVTSEYGCRDSTRDVLQILPEHRFWMPTAFTPNKDGRNDYFAPISIGVADYKLQVFDRWGKKIYESENPREAWNGTFNDYPCKQDVYTWKVEYRDILNNRIYSMVGQVTLMNDQ